MTETTSGADVTRFNYAHMAPDGYRAMLALEAFLHASGLEPSLIHLVKLRVSQINGCAFCIDMHWKDLRALGETEQRLYSLDAWQECPWYSERERAALRWAEAVTVLADGHVSDEVYREASSQLDDKDLCSLTFVVSTINAWNRLCIASRKPPGTYQPAK
jgi:AhpD family alkylhydroperoxidase